MNPGDWAWNAEHGAICRVIDVQTVWDHTLYRVWLSTQDAVVRVRADRLKPLEAHSPILDSHHFSYIVSAARIADALAQDVLLAPLEAPVIPLPHQIRALRRAISGDRVRYLLADEVGLGKTIEAGLILRQLKLRGLVRRTLVVAPKGLVTQWVSEMRTHFHEDFHPLIPGDFASFQPFVGAENFWRACDQVVCSMDSVKPIDGRRGWSREQVADYNRRRFDDLIAAGWDLIIVDEAHRLGGSTDQVARYKLGQGLAEAAPYLLLLTATPHQGKTDAFLRLMALLDPAAFPDPASVTRERVQPYVIRTEKRQAIDPHGQPLFKPRETRLLPIAWETRHRDQRLLYEAVTEYVREGYNQAVQEKKPYLGFLMLLMQRLVTSSTRAIRTALERRLEVLQMPKEQLTLFPVISEEEWADLDGQDQLERLLNTRLAALKHERTAVEWLLTMATRTEAARPDAKAETLLDWMYRLQRDEGDPDLKMLIFTEFVPTQAMLREFLSERGFAVVCLNGSMALDERQRVQEAFAREARILISTDAGGEGLNLQFCHVVINYDLPWNPMRIEQRIGRVDRIGQAHIVRAMNFVLEGTVEHRVQEVLQDKLAVILAEFGVDKTADILDSAQAEQLFDDLYVGALTHPEDLEATVESVVSRLRDQAKAAREGAALLGEKDALDPAEAQRVMDHPLLYWVERMTVSYLRSAECEVRSAEGARPSADVVGQDEGHNIWRLIWPDGSEQIGAFTTHRALRTAHLGLHDPRVRNLLIHLPCFAPGQPIPCLRLPGMPLDVHGFWSLWRIALQTEGWNRQRVMPLFLHDDGRVLLPTARRIWDLLLSDAPEGQGYLSGSEALAAFDRQREVAEVQGKSEYEELVRLHRARLARERKKGTYAFEARRRALDRIGLPAVRAHRLALLEQEERAWRERLERQADIMPELVPLAIVKVRSAKSVVRGA
ncbi:MAG TPA: helicase-related protein [Alphaproteobacteria bacterium]|nr:helicase-related protein [Alphaproteobacteria bacterium]